MSPKTQPSKYDKFIAEEADREHAKALEESMWINEAHRLSEYATLGSIPDEAVGWLFEQRLTPAEGSYVLLAWEVMRRWPVPSA